ncbi:ankyrin repeat domain-containing protein SOWAHA [Eucyclogobius newberryi]|uniref:ankyrin repeat domain-containing protein SOWAHA n=1 Tax=Eucyclogobius newberryi TaxID=166745 RepID=UPI003B5AF4F0
MDLTQQSVLSFLIAEGGTVRKSALVRRFKGSTDCDDPAERERNRALFRDLVNSVAVVREVDGAKYVVVRRKYEPLVESYRAREEEKEEEKEEKEEEKEEGKEEEERAAGARADVVPEGEPQCPLGEPQRPLDEPQRPLVPSEEARDDRERGGNLNPIAMALQRCTHDVKLKRSMHFDVQSQRAKPQSKPYALPLRTPPTQVQIHKINDDPGQAATGWARASANAGSPGSKRATKSAKVSAEVRESRSSPSLVPLEQTEHEWLVKCASGHWSQVYGMLMRDSQLAEKKDFISGFTALHWAAKFGRSDMLTKILDVSKRGGAEVDVNAKARGGYTPLHIAALHDQEYILAMLVGEYGADAKIRDNCGRRAHHYLHKGVSPTVKEMLGQPKPNADDDKEVRGVQSEKEEQDVFPDLSKGLHSISKLFQPTLTGHKRKSKQRPALSSLQDEPETEGREDGRHRLHSDVFM